MSQGDVLTRGDWDITRLCSMSSLPGSMTNPCPGYTISYFLTWLKNGVMYQPEQTFRSFRNNSVWHDILWRTYTPTDTPMFSSSLPGWVKILWQPFWRALKKQRCQDSICNYMINQSQRFIVTYKANETQNSIKRQPEKWINQSFEPGSIC